jgi:uncharacterized membrane protein
MPAPFFVLLFLYPLFVHIAISIEQTIWAVYFLALLLLFPVSVSLLKIGSNFISQIQLSAKISLIEGSLALLAIFILLLADDYATQLLRFQPILIFSMLFILFSSSLHRDSIPLINRFAILMAKDTPANVTRYCRSATIAWALFFLLMLFISSFLALYAPLSTWSLFVNLISYILVGLMFVVEFQFRRWRLKDHVNYSFIQFIRNLRQVEYRDVLKGWHP